MEFLLTALVFIVILTVLVLIHELGHFFVAKKLGIKVEEFGFGFPPKAFSIKRGETEYSINWLPIGGFVKLYGEDEAGGGKISKIKDQISKIKKEDIHRAFFARPVGQRAIVVIAGVIMNAVLAVILFYLFLGISNFKTELPLIGDYKFFGVRQENIKKVIIKGIAITYVVKDSPMYEAGVRPIVKVVSVDGMSTEKTQMFIDYIKSKKGEEVKITVEDPETKERKTVNVVPRVNPPANQGALGVELAQDLSILFARLSYETQNQKILSGFVHPLNLLGYNLVVMKNLVAASFREKSVEPVSQGVAGPVGIGSVVGSILKIEELKEKVLQLLNLAGILSISLAFFNILPIPALDGGRLFFILIEGVTGRKVNQRFETLAHTIGMAVLLALILLITFKDLSQIFR